ncbi:Cell-division-associated, ABC-transporter-like signaling protein FtsX [hydrothermal vent metagenome]|uniref:Cell division protein FtsX n=1 Tax=hydrothermal vent metagenome TaxID=652676 RepID=A0A3B0SCY2_9ZZZZ
MRRLSYMLSEAFRNISRNLVVVLGAVLAVFISLFLTFGSVIFGQIAEVTLEEWSNDVRVIAYLRDDVPDPAALVEAVAAWDGVDSVVFFSKLQAIDEARRLFANDPSQLRLLEDDPSFIPTSLRVAPSDLEEVERIQAQLQGLPGVDQVRSADDAVRRLISLRTSLQTFSLVLATALGFAAIALIANTIHMAIYARREEIEIMQLVGASRWFVRTPFVIEGVVEGTLGGLFAVGFIVMLYRMALQADLPNLISIDVGSGFLSQWSILIVAFGALVGFVGSALSLTLHRGIKL